ncbi:MAG: TetR/AcrR family transcriptional regulator, partial [Candidatus Marinimicrobia bacterium]|nr:TetR/AcrR family transcriptional regulator [Candidatus Neomarinimicrobiota bacterium]
MAPIPKDENKRQRIIEAALKVFAEVGVSNGKIATIAKKAGIGKGTVYEYFSSKEDVFAAVFKVFFQKMMAGYNALIQQDMDPVEKIELILDYTYDFFDESLSGENSADWL